MVQTLNKLKNDHFRELNYQRYLKLNNYLDYCFAVNDVRFLWIENNVLSYTKAEQAEGTTSDPFRRFVVTASSLTRRIKG